VLPNGREFLADGKLRFGGRAIGILRPSDRSRIFVSAAG
jgi:hypothetical protein